MCSIMCCCRAGADREEFSSLFGRSEERGPDDTSIVDTGRGLIGFKRLAIMGLSPEGMQPFSDKDICVACNGELYGFRPVREALIKEGWEFKLSLIHIFQYTARFLTSPEKVLKNVKI